MSKVDSTKLGQVIKNVYNLIDKNTPNRYDSVPHGAIIEATGHIVAALILKEKTIYFDYE